MSINKQLLFILLFVTACLFILTFCLKLSIDDNIETILNERISTTKNVTVTKALSINCNDIRQCTNDYSVWNDFVDFIHHKKNISWAKTELVDNAASYRINYLWVLQYALNP